MHTDHILGLIGFFQTLSLQCRKKPIDIYGPKLLYNYLTENIRILNINLSFPLYIHVIEDREGNIIIDKEYKITFCRSNHGHDIISYAYCLVENNRPGKFNVKKAKELCIPEGILYQKLHHC